MIHSTITIKFTCESWMTIAMWLIEIWNWILKRLVLVKKWTQQQIDCRYDEKGKSSLRCFPFFICPKKQDTSPSFRLWFFYLLNVCCLLVGTAFLANLSQRERKCCSQSCTSWRRIIKKCFDIDYIAFSIIYRMYFGKNLTSRSMDCCWCLGSTQPSNTMMCLKKQ